jgi:hypothetical protein
MEDAITTKRLKHQKCVKMKKMEGFTEKEAELSCSKALADGDCISNKISIFSREHPEWSHDKVVAAAHGYCRNKGHKDAIDLSNIIARSRSLSLSKFSTLIKALKTRISQKVPHMGILPQKITLPMKNLNRLQTKLEKTITAEQKWLTSEELQQRTQYAKHMRKTDADEELDDEEFTDSINHLYTEIIDYYPLLSTEEAIDRAFEPPQGDNAWIMSDEAQIISMNDGLNNVIKAPIILAKEMVQMYKTEDGGVEYHFKPYLELQRAIEDIKQVGSLDIIIEHQDWYDEEHVIGHVKEFRADDSTRTIRGIGYFYVGKLPEGLKQMITDGEIIPVSIGFLAKLGGSGVYNDVDFDHTQENIVLRHLAVCLESVARCPAGVCGINLKDSEKTENRKTFIIISKDNYFYNICNIFNDSKKETNKSISKNNENLDTMQEDSDNRGKITEKEPSDLEAILQRLRSLINDDGWEAELKSNAIERILAALGVKGKSDSKMDEKEFQDAIAKKDSELKDLRKELADAKAGKEKAEKIVRQNFIKAIKRFGDKYSDEELESKELKTLEEIADAVSRFAPTEEKADIIPVAPKDDKKEMEDQVGKKERVDFSHVFDDVNKEFNLEGM